LEGILSSGRIAGDRGGTDIGEEGIGGGGDGDVAEIIPKTTASLFLSETFGCTISGDSILDIVS
jgi:hypothetical protein